MSNQEARGILAELEAYHRALDPLRLTSDSITLVNERIEALEMAISALRRVEMLDTLEQRGLKEFRK